MEEEGVMEEEGSDGGGRGVMEEGGSDGGGRE